MVGQSTQKKTEKEKSSLSSKSTARWTFLTNHAHVLILLNREPDLVLREVASRIGITERAVQKIVHDLKEEGFLKLEKVGRQNHYKVLKSKPLRHAIEAHRKIGELLDFINTQK